MLSILTSLKILLCGENLVSVQHFNPLPDDKF